MAAASVPTCGSRPMPACPVGAASWSRTLQTFDPRIYAVGECASHRGIAYGLVAPLFEQARVCANHLAMLGFSRYPGSVTSTKLKVTGIDLFSAGDFMGGEGSETLTLRDPVAGIYRKLVIRDDRLVGACLYGDTRDSAWYLRQIRERRDLAALRDRLMFDPADAEAELPAPCPVVEPDLSIRQCA